jgi:hypothetical protein
MRLLLGSVDRVVRQAHALIWTYKEFIGYDAPYVWVDVKESKKPTIRLFLKFENVSTICTYTQELHAIEFEQEYLRVSLSLSSSRRPPSPPGTEIVTLQNEYGEPSRQEVHSEGPSRAAHGSAEEPDLS